LEMRKCRIAWEKEGPEADDSDQHHLGRDSDEPIRGTPATIPITIPPITRARRTPEASRHSRRA
jgi:hypothetical protein